MRLKRHRPSFGLYNRKRGAMLPLVMGFLCVMGILVFSFSRGASHSSQMVFRIEREETAKKVLEAAVDEAFVQLDGETEHPGDTTKWLIENGAGNPITWNQQHLPRTKGMLESLNKGTSSSLTDLSIRLSKRVSDFRNYQIRGSKVPYYGREGQGTVVFQGTIQVMQGRQSLSAFTLERHHDYKVTCLVSARHNPDRSLAPNRNLDYLLYVREGYAEFQETTGLMLNNQALSLEFRPHGRGRIFFGGTENPGSFIFLNLGQHLVARIPADDGTKSLDTGEKDQLVDQLFQAPDLVPKMITVFGNKDEDETGNTAVEHEAAQKLFRENLHKQSVSVQSQNIPFSPQPADKEKDARENLFGDPAVTRKPIDNTQVGITLLPLTEEPHKIIEGFVRQRFLRLVEILPQGLLGSVLSLLPAKPAFLLSYTTDTYVNTCAKRGGEAPQEIVLSIYRFLEKMRPDSLKSTVTKVEDEFLYGSKLESGGSKAFSGASVPTTYQPFMHRNLRSYALEKPELLDQIGVYSNNQLSLRGWVHVTANPKDTAPAPLVLGANGTVTHSGRGILSTTRTIVLKAGINTAPDALLILITPRKVVVETSEKITAAIIAHTIEVAPGNSFNLTGSLCVNRLGSAKWPSGPHIIEYDAQRFWQDLDDIYTVNVSPRISFIRLSAGGLP
jgi:hypothetical protein